MMSIYRQDPMIQNQTGTVPHLVNMYGLLTKLVRSRWLDIGQLQVPSFASLWTETESGP